MAKTETQIDLKINKGTYAKIQENLSQIGEDELIITDDKNIPVPVNQDEGKVLYVNNGDYALDKLSNVLGIEVNVAQLGEGTTTISLTQEQENTLLLHSKEPTQIIVRIGTDRYYFYKEIETETVERYTCITPTTSALYSYMLQYTKNSGELVLYDSVEVQIKNLITDIETHKTENGSYPSTKAVYDYCQTLGIPVLETTQDSWNSSFYLTQDQLTFVNQNAYKTMLIHNHRSAEDEWYLKNAESSYSAFFAYNDYGNNRVIRCSINKSNGYVTFETRSIENGANKKTSVSSYSSSNTYYPTTKAVYDFVKGETKYIIVSDYSALSTTNVSEGTLAYCQTIDNHSHEAGFYQYKNNTWNYVELENIEPINVTITGNFDVSQTYTFTIDSDDMLPLLKGATLVIGFTGGGSSIFRPDFFQTGQTTYTSSAVVVLNNTQYIATIDFDLSVQNNNATLSFSEIEGGSGGGGTGETKKWYEFEFEDSTGNQKIYFKLDEEHFTSFINTINQGMSQQDPSWTNISTKEEFIALFNQIKQGFALAQYQQQAMLTLGLLFTLSNNSDYKTPYYEVNGTFAKAILNSDMQVAPDTSSSPHPSGLYQLITFDSSDPDEYIQSGEQMLFDANTTLTITKTTETTGGGSGGNSTGVSNVHTLSITQSQSLTYGSQDHEVPMFWTLTFVNDDILNSFNTVIDGINNIIDDVNEQAGTHITDNIPSISSYEQIASTLHTIFDDIRLLVNLNYSSEDETTIELITTTFTWRTIFSIVLGVAIANMNQDFTVEQKAEITKRIISCGGTNVHSDIIDQMYLTSTIMPSCSIGVDDSIFEVNVMQSGDKKVQNFTSTTNTTRTYDSSHMPALSFADTYTVTFERNELGTGGSSSGDSTSASRTLYHIEVADSNNHKAIIPIYKEAFDKFLIEMNQVGQQMATAMGITWTTLNTIDDVKNLFDTQKSTQLAYGCDLAMNLLVKYAYDSGENPVLVFSNSTREQAKVVNEMLNYDLSSLQIPFEYPLGAIMSVSYDPESIQVPNTQVGTTTLYWWFKSAVGGNSIIEIDQDATFTYTEEQVASSGGSSSSQPTVPERFSLAYNLVVNINQEQFANGSWTGTNNDNIRTFQYNGSNADQAKATELVEFLTGVPVLDEYNATKPTPCFVFCTQSNICWKLQWESNGLKAYKVNNFPFVVKENNYCWNISNINDNELRFWLSETAMQDLYSAINQVMPNIDPTWQDITDYGGVISFFNTLKQNASDPTTFGLILAMLGCGGYVFGDRNIYSQKTPIYFTKFSSNGIETVEVTGVKALTNGGVLTILYKDPFGVLSNGLITNDSSEASDGIYIDSNATLQITKQ